MKSVSSWKGSDTMCASEADHINTWRMLGIYKVTLDSKWRLVLPAGLREFFPPKSTVNIVYAHDHMVILPPGIPTPDLQNMLADALIIDIYNRIYIPRGMRDIYTPSCIGYLLGRGSYLELYFSKQDIEKRMRQDEARINQLKEQMESYSHQCQNILLAQKHHP